MKTDLSEAMTAGVYIEVRDEKGNTVGQAVFLGWQGRPLPAVGDRVCCELDWLVAAGPRKRSGRVVSRHFDIQKSENGGPRVWAVLLVQADGQSASQDKRLPGRGVRFSRN